MPLRSSGSSTAPLHSTLSTTITPRAAQLGQRRPRSSHVAGLVGVDEDQVERTVERRDRLERRARGGLDPSAYGAARDVAPRANATCFSLMSQVMIRPPGGSASAIDERGVAGEGADLEHQLRPEHRDDEPSRSRPSSGPTIIVGASVASRVSSASVRELGRLARRVLDGVLLDCAGPRCRCPAIDGVTHRRKRGRGNPRPRSLRRLGQPVAVDREEHPWPSSRSACSVTRCCAPRPSRSSTSTRSCASLVKDLTETMLDAPGVGPGRAAARRRPAGVHLRRRRRGRAPDQPQSSTCPTRSRTATEGCLSFPGPRPSTPSGRCGVVAKGFEHARRAGRRSRAPSCWPAASSTRPTTSTASCSSTGSTEASARGDEGDPRGRVGRRGRAAGQGQPARHLRPGALARVRLVFAGTPEVGRPVAATRCSRSRHEVVAVVTRPDAPAGRGRQLVALAGRPSGPTRHGVEVLKPAEAARPGLPRPAARARTRLLPGGRLRRAGAAAPRSTSRRTAG